MTRRALVQIAQVAFACAFAVAVIYAGFLVVNAGGTYTAGSIPDTVTSVRLTPLGSGSVVYDDPQKVMAFSRALNALRQERSWYAKPGERSCETLIELRLPTGSSDTMLIYKERPQSDSGWTLSAGMRYRTISEATANSLGRLLSVHMPFPTPCRTSSN